MSYLSLDDVKYSSIFLAYLAHILIVVHYTFSSLHHPGLAIYEINNTVALLRDILFRNHLDCLLCDYTSHEGSSVRNVGGGSTNTRAPSVGSNLRKRTDLQFSDGILEANF